MQKMKDWEGHISMYPYFLFPMNSPLPPSLFVENNYEFNKLFASKCTSCGGVFRERYKSGDIISSCGFCYSLKQKKDLRFVKF